MLGPFGLGDLKRIARTCRWCGVKSYLALNVIVYDDELETLREICEAAKAARVDAVIASDIAAIEHARALACINARTCIREHINARVERIIMSRLGARREGNRERAALREAMRRMK